MNPSGLYELVEKLWRHDQWVGFLVGLLLAACAGVVLLKLLLPHVVRGKIEGYKVKVDDLRDDLAARDGEIDRLRAEKAQVQERLDEANKHRDLLKQLSATLESQIKAGATDLKKSSAEYRKLQNDLVLDRDRLAQSEAKLAEAEARLAEVQGEVAELHSEYSARLEHGVRRRWDQPAGDGAVRFEPLHVRHMPIISVVNLKGGVGKTTLTANLGATLARRGHRVLLVDLDYQGSLTSLCLSPGEYDEARKARRFVQDLLRDGATDLPREIFRNAVRLEDLDVGHACLLAADDGLDEVELQALARRLSGAPGDDARFRLRSALHDPAIRQEYDVVLLDCPPRLSTGCVNALAASGYALIPVVPEPISAEATPRLLAWLRNFQRSCCQQLAVLGVVGNRVKSHLDRPIRRQLDCWNNLKPDCHKAWGADVRFFDKAMVRQFTGLSHRLAALTPEGKPVMDDLVNQILQDIPPYARLRSPAVPPLAHPAAAVVRG